MLFSQNKHNKNINIDEKIENKILNVNSSKINNRIIDTTNKMNRISQERVNATRKYENIHNLLWNESGFTPEKALAHMNLFIAYRIIEQHIDRYNLPQECKWSYIVGLQNDEHDLDEAIRIGINAFRRNDITKIFFKPHSIKSSGILRRLIQEIESLDVDYCRENDILGDVFEYMIGRGMSTMSDEGQYFTVREICKLGRELCFEIHGRRIFREDESLCTFCDPFCGTGGFVIEYLKGVREELNRRGIPVDWETIKSSIYSQDMSEDAVRNTILNQLIITGEPPNPQNIITGNSFKDPIINGQNASFSGVSFDYMMMNPPYGGDKSKGKDFKFKYFRIKKGQNGRKQKVYCVNPEIQSIGIEDHDKVSAGVQLAMATLSEDGGVCVIVLPQGFFFGVSKKSVELRRRLTEEYCVHYVVEIEGGAFANTGTKTAMMIFQRGIGSTEEIKFINLDREPLATATLEDLRGKNYSFNYKQYVPQEECEIEGFEMVRLGDIVSFEKKVGHYKSRDGTNSGRYPLYTCGQNIKFVDTCEYNKYCIIINRGGLPNVRFDKNFSISRDDIHVLSTTNENTLKYIYYYLKTIINKIGELMNGTTLKHLNKSVLSEIQIPLPSLERQQEIVRAIDVWEDFTHREEEMVKILEEQMMFEVKEMGRGKPRVRLGDVCEINGGKSLTKKELVDGDVPVVGGGIKPMGYHTSSNTEPYLPIVSLVGANSGNISHYSVPCWITNNGGIVSPKREMILVDFLYYVLKKNETNIKFLADGTAQPKLNVSAVLDMEIPLPPLAEQQRLQSDFDEIRHKHAKIAEYKAKAQDAIRRLIPGAESRTTPAPEHSPSVECNDNETQNTRVTENRESAENTQNIENITIPDFSKMKVKELRNYARQHNIKGFSNKNKAKLIEMLDAYYQSSLSL
jgi:restriction endonuclease S subunit